MKLSEDENLLGLGVLLAKYVEFEEFGNAVLDVQGPNFSNRRTQRVLQWESKDGLVV